MGKHDTTKQWGLLNRWVDCLAQIPTVEVIWLEGSLARNEGTTPSSDIDLRVAISDDAHKQLWETNRTPLLEGLGEYLPLLPLDFGFVRVLTKAGVVVELLAYKTSELDGLEAYEWKFLLCRLSTGEPRFKKFPERSPAEMWPDMQELSVDSVRQLANNHMLVLAQVPTPFYSGETYAARHVLDFSRIELVKLMFRRIGLRYAKRYKHLSEVLPAEFISDLEKTHIRCGESPLEPTAVADATMRTFDILGKHLQALSDKVGGGFESEWYYRLRHQVRQMLQPFLRD